MPPILLYAVAIITGLATAWFNTRSDSPLPIVAQAVVTFGLAFLSPKRAWRWALITGVPAAFVQFLAANGLFQAPYDNESWHAIVTALPGFAAAYAAAMFRVYPERRAFDRTYVADKAARRAAEADSGDDDPASG